MKVTFNEVCNTEAHECKMCRKLSFRIIKINAI